MSAVLQPHVPKQPPRQSLAANVRKRRDELGYSQEKLADRAGLDTRFLRRIEAVAGSDVRVSTLMKLAAALRCDPGALLVPTRMPPAPRRSGRPRKKVA